MSSGKIQHRIDPQLQKRAENILKIQGIKPSQAITMFYTQIVRFGSFPFLPSPVEIPNEELAKDLMESDDNLGLETFNSEKDFFASLHAL